MIETGEILQTMAMIQEQNFDIRTITLGINLLDCSHPSPEACAHPLYFVWSNAHRLHRSR